MTNSVAKIQKAKTLIIFHLKRGSNFFLISCMPWSPAQAKIAFVRYTPLSLLCWLLRASRRRRRRRQKRLKARRRAELILFRIPKRNFASASTQRTNYACAPHNILSLCCFGLRRPNWVKSNKACTSLSLRRINEIQHNIKCSATRVYHLYIWCCFSILDKVHTQGG